MPRKKHQRETEFLRQCLRREGGDECQALDDRITQTQRDECCVSRAMWVTVMLIALAVVGLGYTAALVDNFPNDTPQFVLNIISALGLASIICLIVFVGLKLVYRMKLHQRREECRQLVKRLLESRPVKPVITPLPDSHEWPGNRKTLAVDTGGDDSSDKAESITQG